jgi:asparagine synthase (glutamine-hydrolysing)
MCGIAGIVNYSNYIPITRETLINMSNALSHRGPDHSGIWISDECTVGLAHQRLSIIDLSSRAMQPMSNEDGNIQVIFNGCIYNHIKLRRELEKEGHTFKSLHSDTEVIVHGFESFGIDILNKLNGIFAIAIWDNKKKELWLARDRVGVKPLYYSTINSSFIFASEIKSLFKYPECNKEILDNSIYQYLTFLTVPAPETMFRNIKKLEAGKYLKVNQYGNIEKKTYWDSKTLLNNPIFDSYDIASNISSNLLHNSIFAQTISDVPFSTTLSSGVDSSLISAITNEINSNFYTFTIDYNVKSNFGESELARIISKKLGLKDFNVLVVNNNDIFSHYNNYLKIQNDYPIGSPDIILLYILSKKLKELGIKVCLFGEGADELGGYPSYLSMDLEHRTLLHFSKYPKSIKNFIYKISPENFKDKIEIAMGKSIISRKHIQSFSQQEKEDMWNGGGEIINSYLILEDLMNEIDIDTPDSFIRKVCNIEFKLRLPEFMLPRIDYPMMANSIEGRVPFLDHNLVEYYLRLPFNIKSFNNIPKYLFKNHLSNYLDNEIVNRPKLGFGKVLSPLLNLELPLRFKFEVLDIKNHPIFYRIKRSYLEKILKEHTNKKNYGFKIWTIYSLAKWLEIHET